MAIYFLVCDNKKVYFYNTIHNISADQRSFICESITEYLLPCIVEPHVYYLIYLQHTFNYKIINPIKYLCPFRYFNNSLSILRNKYLYNILIIIPLCQPTPQREHFDFLLLFLISVTCVHVLQITVNKKL